MGWTEADSSRGYFGVQKTVIVKAAKMLVIIKQPKQNRSENLYLEHIDIGVLCLCVKGLDTGLY